MRNQRRNVGIFAVIVVKDRAIYRASEFRAKLISTGPLNRCFKDAKPVRTNQDSGTVPGQPTFYRDSAVTDRQIEQPARYAQAIFSADLHSPMVRKAGMLAGRHATGLSNKNISLVNRVKPDWGQSDARLGADLRSF